MVQLRVLHAEAIVHTKNKILEDMDNFLGSKDSMPSLEQYLEKRMHYIEQIWVNVWLNKVTNEVPKTEKKAFLSEKGYEVEGTDRRIINHLFRTEMRDFQPFHTIDWVRETFLGQAEIWEKRYEKARLQFLKDREERAEEEKKISLIQKIDNGAQELIEDNYQVFYLYVRYFVGSQMKEHFLTKRKYKKIDTFALEEKLTAEGRFQTSDYFALQSFLEELTGDIHKTRHGGRTFFEYETYYDLYEKLITNYLFKLVPEEVTNRLATSLKAAYEQIYHEPLSSTFVHEVILDDILELKWEYFGRIQGEYVKDLIGLAEQPFDILQQEEIYEQQLSERETRKREFLAALERKKEEEARMLEDIFAQEYRPSAGSNIHYVLHIGETNTGKTHHALKKMGEAKSGLYLAPLRLLALEVYDKLNQEGIPCTLKTGEEEKVIENASHFSCTVEMFREKDYFDCVVIDEAQMIADKDRGFAWYKAITRANAREVHIVGSRSLKSMVLMLLGESSIEIHEYSRDIPLQIERKRFEMNQTKKGDALVCFSRKRVLETAARLQNNGFSVSMIYGSMPPETRKKQIQRFIEGKSTVVVATDAIGMGLNLPIRRIVFLENEKFDGTRRRRLTSQEVKQIAGRAGRKEIYDVGKVAFVDNIKEMKDLLSKEDQPVHTFAIAPTNGVFERFQKYSRDLGTFFELWDKFESPKGTEKATLHEERGLYELILGTEIEARLSMMDLYGFLHLPFSTKDPGMTEQWLETMYAICFGEELPEPRIKKRNLEELELSYKAIGLHLLFLYKLGKRTEALYWERLREELSDDVHEFLNTEVKKMTKKCRICGKSLPWEHPYSICDRCHLVKYERWD
jgi:ATP-dependent RNA helicase SUPV3L1/SUV3